MNSISRIKGFADLLSSDCAVMTHLEKTARDVFSLYGYNEIRIPIVEKTELFARSIGEETDVVQKEMYTFPDRKMRSLTLRPEATAGILRAYIENKVYAQSPVSRLYSFGPMFRYERPQKGRMRQFHQIDAECLGPDDPYTDSEVILMLWSFLTALSLPSLSIEINSLGCKECRPHYNASLIAFLENIDDNILCDDCRRRKSANPLRVLDCKNQNCKSAIENAPKLIDHICESCKVDFETVVSLLHQKDLPFEVNHRLVRGLDYYSKTTFEIVSGDIGSQSAVAGGGRYDGLIRQLGGPDIPGTGFACGMERLALLVDDITIKPPLFFSFVLHETLIPDIQLFSESLRSFGISGEVSYSVKSMKSQLRYSDKQGFPFVFILGPEEKENDRIQLRNMLNGDQKAFSFADISTIASYIQTSMK